MASDNISLYYHSKKEDGTIIESGWRTLTIRSGNRISLNGGMLIVSEENNVLAEVPLRQIGTCVFDSTRISVTVPLLRSLAEAGTAVIFCDEKHNPACELLGYTVHTAAAGRILDQAAWTQEGRDALWRQIIRNKIGMQISLLRMENRHVPRALSDCGGDFPEGETDSREARAARLYFRALFGFGFLRHSSDNDNSMLNYGYAVIRSTVNQAVVSCGYHPALGIHHHSRENPFNLSCDLMEPFRPFVDRIVCEQNASGMEQNERNALLSVLDAQCRYRDTVSTVRNVIGRYVSDAAAAITDRNPELPEVSFV